MGVSQPIEVLDATIQGNNIKKVLDKLELTQEEGAKLAGISYRHFNRIVLKDCEPSLLIALRLETVLKKPVRQIFDIKLKTRRVKRPNGRTNGRPRRRPA